MHRRNNSAARTSRINRTGAVHNYSKVLTPLSKVRLRKWTRAHEHQWSVLSLCLASISLIVFEPVPRACLEVLNECSSCDVLTNGSVSMSWYVSVKKDALRCTAKYWLVREWRRPDCGLTVIVQSITNAE